MNYYDPSLIAPSSCLELIRLGRNKDGGYVLPSICLSASKYLLSAGIYTDWSFEDHFIASSQLVAYLLVDPTTSVKSLFSLTSDMIQSPQYSVRSKLLQSAHFLYNLFRVPIMRARYRNFFVESYLSPFDSVDIGDACQTISIPQCLDMLGVDCTSNIHEPSVFLKLDIEGSEYDIIDDIVLYSRFFSGIALEVHDLDVRSHDFSALMKSLLAAGFIVAHCHPNNAGGVILGTNLPRLLEITLINRQLVCADSIYPKSPPFTYQLGLDFPCDPRLPELEVSNNAPHIKPSSLSL